MSLFGSFIDRLVSLLPAGLTCWSGLSEFRLNDRQLVAVGSGCNTPPWTELTFNVASLLQPFNVFRICVPAECPLQVHSVLMHIHEHS